MDEFWIKWICKTVKRKEGREGETRKEGGKGRKGEQRENDLMCLCIVSTIAVRGRREEKREGARRERGKKRENMSSFSVFLLSSSCPTTSCFPSNKERTPNFTKEIYLT